MTECNTKSIAFSRVRRRQVIADFNGGRLTTDAGVLLLREVDRQIGLLDAINDCIPDPRDPRYTVHQQREMLAQRIFSLALGYEDLNDQQTLRDDPALQVAAGKLAEEDSPLASPPTLCRLENRVNRKALVEMSKLLVEHFLAAQKSRKSHPKKSCSISTPPTIRSTASRRDGSIRDTTNTTASCRSMSSAADTCCVPCCGHRISMRPNNSRAITKLLVQRIRQQWPDVKIIIRGDSGFCRWKLMRWCDKHGVDYVFGLGRNKVLERRIAPLMKEAEAAFEATGEKQRLFDEIDYAAGTWDRERRVVMKAERLPEGPNRRFVVTSLTEEAGQLYDDIYTQRGDMENRIKEQQLMLFADRTSCHDFLANQFRLLLSSFAYVLLHKLRESHLAGTDLEKAQVNRIRLVLLKVAARVTVSVRRVVLHLSSSCPFQNLFRRVAASLIPDSG